MKTKAIAVNWAVAGMSLVFVFFWMLNWTTCNMADFSQEVCSVTLSGSFQKTLYAFIHFPESAWGFITIIGAFFARLGGNLK